MVSSSSSTGSKKKDVQVQDKLEIKSAQTKQQQQQQQQQQPTQKLKQNLKIDNRPHEQRVKQQRKARRLNHSFMHLYRHDNPLFDDQQIAPSSKSMTCAKTYLMEYGSFDTSNGTHSTVNRQTIEQMSIDFPPLLELDVKRHLRPKMRFLKYTLGCSTTDSSEDYDKITDIKDISSIPPQYFGARLEKVIAPRHAFLMSKGLPHGKVLLENDAELFKEFLIACRRSKSFCALCNQWKAKYGGSSSTGKYRDLHYGEITDDLDDDNDAGMVMEGKAASNVHDSLITPKEVDAFDALFTR